MSRVLLCVTGGIAAYKAAALTSTLVQRGTVVDVAMTADAERFIAPLTFSALTGRTVYASLWDAPERIPHIRLVREADAVLVVPATANIIAKLANGIADDLVSTALLAARIPVILAPAMNDAMYAHGATQNNLRDLRARGCIIVEPDRGYLAEGERGIGRLASEDAILSALDSALADRAALRGVRVLITAGPTREHFDPVRFVSNPATGATGIALAQDAARRGAAVTLILGPTALEPPAGIETVRVRTAQEMYDAAMQRAPASGIVIATAAVSDYAPADVSERKEKKDGDERSVRMRRTPDILADLAARAKGAFVVGFAAETDDHERNAREKLTRKGLDAIAVNDVAGGRAFGAQPNALHLLWGTDGARDLGSGSKDELAARLLEAVIELRAASEKGGVHAAGD